MILVSDDPSWWPVINSYRVGDYFVAATCVGVTYDWALTFGQEVELIWRQNWSPMTIMYLSVRYLGVLSVIREMLIDIPTMLLTDTGCRILYFVYNWRNVVAFLMLCVIMIARLHAMYQRSRRILIFLVVVCLAVNIFDVVANIMMMRGISGEVFILSNTYQCTVDYTDDASLLNSVTWILGTVWEVLALCLSAWITIKHFRELRQHSAGGIIGDCFTVLIKSHVLYFASYVVVSCFNLVILLSPTISSDMFSLETQVWVGLIQVLTVLQPFVMGPRLILSIREYNAQLVADSDTATGMTSIVFQERVHISTSSGV